MVKNSACQHRKHRFDPWIGQIPCATEQPSPRATTIEPVFWGQELLQKPVLEKPSPALGELESSA